MEHLSVSALAGLASVVLTVSVELKSGLGAFTEARRKLLVGPRTAIAETCETGLDRRSKVACRVVIDWRTPNGWGSPCESHLPLLARRYYRIRLVCYLGKFQIYRRTTVVLR